MQVRMQPCIGSSPCLENSGTMATKRKHGSSSDDRQDRIDLRAQLTGVARVSKASVARVLSVLSARGELVDDRLGADLKKEEKLLQRATCMHGNAMTPYGTVIQGFKLTADYVMQYVHPCAYLYYLSSICDHFAHFINDLLDKLGPKPLSIIVYGDEMTPGNPLRPDTGREAWQWSFSILEFPNHVLHSHAGWIHITTLRTTVVNTMITGHVPMLAKSILHILFVQQNNL